MPASRIKAFRVPVVSMLLLLLLLYTPLVACKTNNARSSSAAANADDYPLLNDGSVSLSISPSQKSNSICLEVPGDGFSITAIRPSCADKEPSVSFWFGDGDCKMRFNWTTDTFALFGDDHKRHPSFPKTSQKVSFTGRLASFKDDLNELQKASSCPVKKENVEKGKNVVRFSMKSQSELGCPVKVEFPSDYIRYTKPTEPPSTESQSTSTDATHVSSPTESEGTAQTVKKSSEGTVASTVSTSGMPWWGWTLIVGGCLLLLAVVIGLVLYFFVWPRKKKKRQSRKLKEGTTELPTQSEPIVPSKQMEISEVKETEVKKPRGEVLSPRKAESTSGKENQRKSEEHPGFVFVPFEGEKGDKAKMGPPPNLEQSPSVIAFLKQFPPFPPAPADWNKKPGEWKPKDSVKE